MVWIKLKADKKVFSTRIDGNLIKKLKHLSVDEDASLGNLLEEAIEDLLNKYEKQEKKPKK
jgi:predicted transcriptional regulator